MPILSKQKHQTNKQIINFSKRMSKLNIGKETLFNLGFLCFLLLSCQNKKEINNRFEVELNVAQLDSVRQKYQIKEMKHFIIEPKKEFGIKSFDSTLMREEYYNPHGTIVKEVQYEYWNKGRYSNSRLNLKEIKEYDDIGNLIYTYHWKCGNCDGLQSVKKFRGELVKALSQTEEKFYNEIGKETEKKYSFISLEESKEYLIKRSVSEWLNDSVNVTQFFDIDGQLIEKFKIHVNEKGEEILKEDLISNTPVKKLITKYNDNGDLIFYESHIAGVGNVRYEHIYDGGKEVEYRGSSCEGEVGCTDFKMFVRITFRYDELGNKIEELWFSKSGEIKQKKEWMIDYENSDDNLTITEKYIDNGKKLFTTEKVYDNIGRIIKKAQIDHQGSDERETISEYKYNSYGLISEETDNTGKDNEIIRLYMYNL